MNLANGFKFAGSECRDEAEAVQSAASVALFQLVSDGQCRNYYISSNSKENLILITTHTCSCFSLYPSYIIYFT